MTEVNDAEMHTLGLVHTHTQQVAEACQRLCRLLERQDTPAIPEVVTLSETVPRKRLQTAVPAKSLAIVNPSPVQVYYGFNGGKATAEAQAWPIAASSAVVLPFPPDDSDELGADPTDLEDGNAVLYVLRFAAVQAFFVGSL